MTAEAGHAPNRSYKDQQGNFHQNGSQSFDSAENPLPFGAPVTVTPTGNNAAGAAPLASGSLSILSGAAAANNGVALPAAAPGLEIPVACLGTTTLVYPAQDGTTIEGGSANAAHSMAANTAVTYIGISDSAWLTK